MYFIRLRFCCFIITVTWDTTGKVQRPYCERMYATWLHGLSLLTDRSTRLSVLFYKRYAHTITPCDLITSCMVCNNLIH